MGKRSSEATRVDGGSKLNDIIQNADPDFKFKNRMTKLCADTAAACFVNV